MCHSVAAATVTSSVAFELGEAPPRTLDQVRGPTALYLDTKGDFDPKRLRNFIRGTLKRSCQLTDKVKIIVKF